MIYKIITFLIFITNGNLAFAQEKGFTMVVARAIKAKRTDIALAMVDAKVSANTKDINSENFGILCEFLLQQYKQDPSTIESFKPVETFLFSYLQKQFPRKCSLDCVTQLLNVQSYYMSPTAIFYRWRTVVKETELLYRVLLSGASSLSTSLKDMENSCKEVLKKPLVLVASPQEHLAYLTCIKILPNENLAYQISKSTDPSVIGYLETVDSLKAAPILKPKIYIDYIIAALFEYTNKRKDVAQLNLQKAIELAANLSQKALATHGLYLVTQEKKYLAELKSYSKLIHFNNGNDGLKYIVENSLAEPRRISNPDMLMPYSILKNYTRTFLN